MSYKDEENHIGHMTENEKLYFKSTLSTNYSKWEKDLIFFLNGIPQFSECIADAIRDRVIPKAWTDPYVPPPFPDPVPIPVPVAVPGEIPVTVPVPAAPVPVPSFLEIEYYKRQQSKALDKIENWAKYKGVLTSTIFKKCMSKSSQDRLIAYDDRAHHHWSNNLGGGQEPGERRVCQLVPGLPSGQGH